MAEPAFKISESEAAFMHRVMEYASLQGWQWMHINKAQNSAGYWRTPVVGDLGRGFPDLLLIRGEEIIALELKSKGKHLTRSQQDVMNVMAATGKIRVRWATPDDWDEVRKVLR